MDFEKLTEIAAKTLNSRQLEKNAWAGQVAAALVTKNGNVYTGVCIDVPCSMGFCAEHAAIAAMITAGENRIEKAKQFTEQYGGNIWIGYENLLKEADVDAVYIPQIHYGNLETEILLNSGVYRLKDLLPHIWTE